MIVRSFSYFYLLIFIFIIYFLINQYKCASVIKSSNHTLSKFLFPQIDKFKSSINQSQSIFNQLQCADGWTRFSGSCYYFSPTQSTSDRVHELCHFSHINNTQLMYIRHFYELFYVAHILTRKNLAVLLVQIDRQVLKEKDRNQWKQFQNKFYSTLSKLTTNKIDNLCHDFLFDILDKNSRIFIFTIYKNSDKTICFLTNVIPNATYPYLCQYVTDFCIDNIKCGKHGRCINQIQDFKCLCSSIYDGDLCDIITRQVKEKIIAVVIIGVFVLVYIIKWIIKHCCNQQKNIFIRIKEKLPKCEQKPNENSTPLKTRLIDCFNNSTREIICGILFIVCLCPQLILSSIIQKHSFPFRNLTEIESLLLVNDTRILFEQKCESNWHIIMKYIIPGISVGVMIIFILFAWIKSLLKSRKNIQPSALDKDIFPEQNQPLLNEQSQKLEMIPLNEIPVSSTTSAYHPLKFSIAFLSPVNIHEKRDRYIIAAIFGILAFEILKIFDEILLAINQSTNDGILSKFSKRIWLIILIGCRYYSILISLRLGHSETMNNRSFSRICIRLLRLIYMIVIIVYTVYRESICLDFLPHSENFTQIDEVQLRVLMGNWFIFYGVIANLPHFIFLSYIAAEFCTCLIFDSFSRTKKEPKKKEIGKKSVPTYESSENNQINERSTFQKFRDWIYKWDDSFQFSTLIISTYTVNFIILFHLSHTFIFLYTTRKMVPILFVTNIFEQIFPIPIKEELFHIEICFSAILTAIVYSIQLFLGIKNFRNHVEIYRERGVKKLIEDTGISQKVRSKAIQYPGYIIRYTFGGFIITFHLLIFLLFIPRLIIRLVFIFKWISDLILTIMLSYLLKILMVQICSKIINNTNEDISSQRTNSNLRLWIEYVKNILQYCVLVANFFIGTMSSIIILIKVIIFNIICINRADSCLFPEAFKKFDSANMAYWCFVHEQVYSMPAETACMVSSDDQNKSLEKVEEDEDDDKTGYEAEEQNSTITSSIDGTLLSESRNVRIKWSNICKKDSSNEASTLNNVNQQLRRIGFKKKAIIGDGNCFFRAVAIQLQRSEKDHLNIRSQAIEYLNSDKLRFAPFLDNDIDGTMEKYIEKMRKNGTYVDHITILATAAVIERDIVIHSRRRTPWLIRSGLTFSSCQIHLWYDSNKEHYDSVVSINGSVPYLSPEQCSVQ